MRRRIRVELRGAVQGVGFRPFVFRLADEMGLAGWVVNDTRGVLVEAEGEAAALETFARRLVDERPPASEVVESHTAWIDPRGGTGFEIRPSAAAGAPTVQVLPDIAACRDCLAEVLDPANRRYRYPFTNCTQCGPRFSILQSLPYDRPRTTMAGFAMCADCRREYEDPRDRRFHAQPNACPACGPQLTLLDPAGRGLAARDDALRGAARALADGKVVAVKGLGGFHLMVDARNADAVRTLRQRKVRRERPLAVMVAGIEDARRCCEADADACALLASPAAPIVLLRRLESAPIDPGVAAGTPYLGIFLAYTPLHLLLLQATGFAVVATSGNLSDEPICIDEREALQRLHGVADLFLVHDRPIARHVDDGLVWRVEAENRVLRRARGDAPRPLHLDRGMPPLLAVGAHLKNCVAVSVGRQAVLSQHIGDMGSPEAFAAFERVVEDLLELFRVQPLAVAHDRHPDYATTRWAAASGLPCVAVQHHHAHLAACLADGGWAGEALGVTWDGAGYGDDGSVWGGEFLLGSAAGFRRVAHLRPFRLPGGDVAAREPRRPALAVLFEALGPGAFERDDLAPVRAFAAAERAVLATMIERGVASPWTSSAGRLFDALASLVGIRHATTFEGQAAMAVEFAAADAPAGAYPLDLVTGDADALVLDWRPLVRAVVDDLAAGTGSGVIAARFHDGLAAGIVRVAREVGCGRVALSGGCFQNRRLLEASTTALRAAGFQVLLHRRVPPGDGGIALGQLAVAASRLG